MSPLDIMTQYGSGGGGRRLEGFSLRKHCFEHTRFKDAIGGIASMHHYCRVNRVSGGINIYGDSGVGKSTIIGQYAEHFPRTSEAGAAKIPVLVVSTPSAPTIKSLSQEILGSLGDLAAHKGSAEEKTQRIYKFLERCQVEVIFLDEFHHFFFAKTANVFRHITDWLKNLMDRSGVCLVLSGLPESEIIVKSNSQLHRRLSETIALTPFSLEDEEDFKEFRGLLRAFQDRLPLPVYSPLFEANLARRFNVATGGRIDYIRKILEGAVSVADSAGMDILDLQIYAAAFRRNIWSDAPDRLNPFHPESILRPLIKPGEPFETGGYSRLIGSPVAMRLGLVGRTKGNDHG